MNATYNFPVELQPIYLPNKKEIPNKKAVVRTDTMDALGVVSNDYSIIKHGDVIDSFREAGKQYNVEEKITLQRNGAQLFYQMKFPKIQMEAKKGDLVQMMMIAKNSYNGMNTLHVVFGAFRLVCLNGMVLGTDFFTFHYKHIGQINQSLNGQYKEVYKQYIDLFGQRTPMIQAMTKKEAKGDKLFDPKATEMPEYLLKEAKTSFEAGKDQSVWGYYNSLTYAVTHKRKKDNEDGFIRNGVRAWKMAEKAMH